MIRYEIELPAATGVNRAATSAVRWAAAGFFPGLAAAGLLNALEVHVPFAVVVLVCMAASAVCGAAWGRSYPTRVSRWFHPDRTPDDLRGPLEQAFGKIPPDDVGLFGHFDRLIEASSEVGHLDEVIRLATAADDQTRLLGAKEQRDELARDITDACTNLESLAADTARLAAKRAQLASPAREQDEVVRASRRLARLEALRKLDPRRRERAVDLETLKAGLGEEADRLEAHSAALDELRTSPDVSPGPDLGAVARQDSDRLSPSTAVPVELAREFTLAWTRAPWTDGQVAWLARMQTEGRVHPLTCGSCRDTLNIEGVLRVAADGLHCDTCGYVQDTGLMPVENTEPGT